MPRSGASYSSIFEIEEAAHWRGLTPRQFDALDGEEQSRIVAHYRAHVQLESVIAYVTRPKPPKGK